MSNINISGHHLDVTDALDKYTRSRMERLQRHCERTGDINVVLSLQGGNCQKAEATVHVQGTDLHAEAEGHDLYASIDEMAAKLDRRLIDHKEKHRPY